VPQVIAKLGQIPDVSIPSPAQGDVVYYDGSDWVALSPGTNGYYLQTQGAGANPQWASLDHGALTGLTDDDHSIYALLAGRSGGQTIIGDTGSGGDLTLQSTSHATRGSVILDATNNIVVDQVNGRVGIGTASPSEGLHVVGDGIETWILATSYNATPKYTNFGVEAAGGSVASPAALTDGQNVGQYFFRGYDGDSFETGAMIRCQVDGAVSDGNVPMDLQFYTGDLASRMVIGADGQVLVNGFPAATTGLVVKQAASPSVDAFQVQTSGGNASMLVNSSGGVEVTGAGGVGGVRCYRYGGVAFQNLYRANGTYASPTASASGDLVGAWTCNGYDGSSFRNAASITVEIDAAVTGGGAADMPGRLLFSTSPDGSATLTERLRIDSAGTLHVRPDGTNNVLEVVDDGTNKIGFFGATAAAQQDITGARDDTEAALANLLTALATLGLITDSTTAS